MISDGKKCGSRVGRESDLEHILHRIVDWRASELLPEHAVPSEVIEIESEAILAVINLLTSHFQPNYRLG